jgi:hypothetical protein
LQNGGRARVQYFFNTERLSKTPASAAHPLPPPRYSPTEDPMKTDGGGAQVFILTRDHPLSENEVTVSGGVEILAAREAAEDLRPEV